MRHGLMACVAGWALSACVLDNPHNDVLVFGTTTKVAVDVSAPVQNGAIPEFTIGYKRNEGVWMPLKANTAADESLADLEPFKGKIAACEARAKADYDARPVGGGRPVGGTPLPKPPFDLVAARERCLAKLLPPEKYLAHSSGIDSQKGGTTEETDTYSVFASFGGRGNLGFGSTAGALAQFFATGIAAQRLGANPGLAAALNAGGADAAKAQAEAEKAQAETEKEKVRSARAVALGELGAASVDEARAALETEWSNSGCPAPGGNDDEKYTAIAKVAADAEKAAGQGQTFVGFDQYKTKKEVMDLLGVPGAYSLTEISRYRDARRTVCGK